MKLKDSSTKFLSLYLNLIKRQKQILLRKDCQKLNNN
nr:MAG TPA: hypothetical protein [Caudoviricetes sp.]